VTGDASATAPPANLRTSAVATPYTALADPAAGSRPIKTFFEAAFYAREVLGALQATFGAADDPDQIASLQLPKELNCRVVPVNGLYYRRINLIGTVIHRDVEVYGKSGIGKYMPALFYDREAAELYYYDGRDLIHVNQVQLIEWAAKNRIATYPGYIRRLMELLWAWQPRTAEELVDAAVA
jgi:hypothetical protein